MSQIPPESQRYAIETEIVLRVGSDEPVTARLWNLSMTGLFIATDKTYPAGTELQFEFRIDSGDEPISGTASVAWRRQLTVDRKRPAGVGVQFQRLIGDGRKQVRAFIKDNPTAQLPRRIPDRATLHNVLEKLDDERSGEGILEYGGAAVATKPSTSVWAPVLSGMALGVFLFGGTYLLFGEQLGQRAALASTNPVTLPSPSAAQLDVTSQVDPGSGDFGASQGDPQDQANQPATPADDGDSSLVAQNTQSDETPAPAPAPTPEPGNRVALQIKDVLSAWSSAWSQQEPEAYLEHYSSSFRPGRGRSLEEWRDYRRDRIRAPEFVRVSISEVEVEHEDDRADVVFFQVYRSDTLEDVVRKSMTMAREGSSWRILSESSETIEVRRL